MARFELRRKQLDDDMDHIIELIRDIAEEKVHKEDRIEALQQIIDEATDQLNWVRIE